MLSATVKLTLMSTLALRAVCVRGRHQLCGPGGRLLPHPLIEGGVRHGGRKPAPTHHSQVSLEQVLACSTQIRPVMQWMDPRSWQAARWGSRQGPREEIQCR